MDSCAIKATVAINTTAVVLHILCAVLLWIFRTKVLVTVVWLNVCVVGVAIVSKAWRFLIEDEVMRDPLWALLFCYEVISLCGSASALHDQQWPLAIVVTVMPAPGLLYDLYAVWSSYYGTFSRPSGQGSSTLPTADSHSTSSETQTDLNTTYACAIDDAPQPLLTHSDITDM